MALLIGGGAFRSGMAGVFRGEEYGMSAELSDWRTGWDGKGAACERALGSSLDNGVGSSRSVREDDERPDARVSGGVDVFVWENVSAFAVHGLKADSAVH